VLTDEQWAVLEPLVEVCRPPAKVPPSNLRRTIGAILWRHENGAKWRAIPEGFGPWWMAAQTVRRSASDPLVAPRRLGAVARHGAAARC
jgi:transposase